MPPTTDTRQCPWPSGLHAYRRGTCTRCGHVQPANAVSPTTVINRKLTVEFTPAQIIALDTLLQVAGEYELPISGMTARALGGAWNAIGAVLPEAQKLNWHNRAAAADSYRRTRETRRANQ